MNAIDVNGAIIAIRNAGASRVRILPMIGEDAINGNYQIEVNQNGGWAQVLTGVKKNMAEQMVTQALNRTICG